MSAPLRGLMAVLIGLGLLNGNAFAELDNKNQRLSIAISGGASKGAYEAGLNWAAL